MLRTKDIAGLLSLTLFLVFSSVSFAQDNTILLLNGKVLEGEVKSNDGEFLKYHYKKKKNEFVKTIDLQRVYSFTQEGKETIVYEMDTLMGNIYSQDEMRMFIYGEQDADKTSKSWPFVVGGFLGGYGISIYDTYSGDDPDTPEDESGFFGTGPSAMHFVAPFVISIGSGMIKPKIKARHVSDIAFLANEQYIIGYQKNARFKRIMGGGLGALSGAVAGFVTYLIAKP